MFDLISTPDILSVVISAFVFVGMWFAADQLSIID